MKTFLFSQRKLTNIILSSYKTIFILKILTTMALLLLLIFKCVTADTRMYGIQYFCGLVKNKINNSYDINRFFC